MPISKTAVWPPWAAAFLLCVFFSCSDSELTDLKKNIGVMSGLGIEVSFHEAENPAEVTNRAGMPLNFELRSMDHPGIVQKVVRLLKSYNINIHSLDTQVKSMPHSGAPLFDLYLKADVPEEVVIGKVKEALSELALEMNLDLTYL